LDDFVSAIEAECATKSVTFFDCKSRLGLSVNDAIRFMIAGSYVFKVGASECWVTLYSSEDPKLMSTGLNQKVSIGRIVSLIRLRGRNYSAHDETSHICRCRYCVRHVVVEPKAANSKRKLCHAKGNCTCGLPIKCIKNEPSSVIVSPILKNNNTILC
jgi:hypothetical protein